MWNHLNGVTQRLKEIANELASPQFEEGEAAQEYPPEEGSTQHPLRDKGDAQPSDAPAMSKNNEQLTIRGSSENCEVGHQQVDHAAPLNTALFNLSTSSFSSETLLHHRSNTGQTTSISEQIVPHTGQPLRVCPQKVSPVRCSEETNKPNFAVSVEESTSGATPSPPVAPALSLKHDALGSGASGDNHSRPLGNSAQISEVQRRDSGIWVLNDVEEAQLEGEGTCGDKRGSGDEEGNMFPKEEDFATTRGDRRSHGSSPAATPGRSISQIEYPRTNLYPSTERARLGSESSVNGPQPPAGIEHAPTQGAGDGGEMAFNDMAEGPDVGLAAKVTIANDVRCEPASTVTTDLSCAVEVVELDKMQLIVERERVKELLVEGKKSLEAVLCERDEVLCKCQEQAERMSQLASELSVLRQLQRDEGGKDNGELTAACGGASDTGEFGYEQAALLREEVEFLRAEIQQAKEAEREAVERARASEQEAYARKVEQFVKEYTEQSQEFVRVLQSQVTEGQQKIEILQEEKVKLIEERQDERRRLVEAQAATEELSARLASSESHIVELQSVIASSSAKASENEGASLICALTARKKELEFENSRLLYLQQQIEQTITNCLVHANVEFPLPQAGGAPVPFSDLVNLLVNEFNRLLEANKQAYQIQLEMERTYENARMVNTTISRQVNEAWKTIGTLREELSLREQTIADLNQQQLNEVQEHRNTQQLLATVTNELQMLKEEVPLGRMAYGLSAAGNSSEGGSSRNFAVGGAQGLRSGEAATEEDVRRLEEDIETLRSALHDRDDELLRAHQATENLQQVLDTFTVNKKRDIEERTAELQVEIDELRGLLMQAEQRIRNHQKDVDEITQGHRHELAAKNVEISALHHKHLELRRALGDTARQLNGEMLIDKRVISHLVVNFIHAFVAGKSESDAMLKVLSGLLNWDEPTQEQAGLIPGPTNPKPGQQRKKGGGRFIGSLMGRVWGRRDTAPGQIGDKNPTPGIAELWVEFLMRESEAGMRESMASSSDAVQTHAETGCAVESEGNEGKNDPVA